MKIINFMTICAFLFGCKAQESEFKDVLFPTELGVMLFYRELENIKIKICEEPIKMEIPKVSGDACKQRAGTSVRSIPIEEFVMELKEGVKFQYRVDHVIARTIREFANQEIENEKQRIEQEKAAEKEALEENISRVTQLIKMLEENKEYGVSLEDLKNVLELLEKLKQNQNPTPIEIDPVNIVVAKMIDKMISNLGVQLVSSRGDNAFWYYILEPFITKEFIKEENTSSRINLEFVEIPAGKFLMGSPRTEKDRENDEEQHEVTISRAFKLMRYEVSIAQWMAVMGANSYSSSKEFYNYPIVGVRRLDIQRFILRLNDGISHCGDTSTYDGFKKAYTTSGCYRLPTEAEWEYAARGGTVTPYVTGEEVALNQFNFFTESAMDVKTEKAFHHPWNLVHIFGNVFELVQDVKSFYDVENTIDPMGEIPGEHNHYIVRGGSWYSKDFWNLRSASRYSVSETSTDDIGFRLVRTL